MVIKSIIRSWIGEIFISSGVRTPIGTPNSVIKNISNSTLGAIVIDSILQRSAINKNDIDHIILDTEEKYIKDILSQSGISDNIKTIIKTNYGGLNTICEAIKMISKSNIILTAGISNENNQNNINSIESKNKTNLLKFEEENIMKYLRAHKNNYFKEEIQKINIPGHPRLNRKEINFNEDEINNTFEESNIGATACILMNKDIINKYNISPLGKIISFYEGKNVITTIQMMLNENNLNISDIDQWEINITKDNEINIKKIIKHLNIDTKKINKHGSLLLKNNSNFSGMQSLIHLFYSLKSKQKAIIININNISILYILIEKNSFNKKFIFNNKPILTLYTKEPCLLCDELKVELNSYLNRINLNEIYLTNESYWYKLYRYEIPIVFLGGRFICKNKFDVEIFEKVLEDIENELNRK